MQNFTSITSILYMNIICNAQWLFGANLEILHCSADFTLRQKIFKQENTFKQTRVDLLLSRKYDVISQLLHSYAKGPFCVARVKWWLIFVQLLYDLTFQPVPDDFDVKTKVNELLEQNDFEKKRARTMDIDDFLGYVTCTVIKL